MLIASITLLVSFLIGSIIGPFVVKAIKNKQFKQSVREDGPQSHLKKTGTPTIGGIIFLIATLITTVIFVDLSFEVLFILTLTFGYGIIGFLDDYIKIALKRNLGLTVKQKLLGQLIVSIIAFVILYTNEIDTNIYIHSLNVSFDIGWFYLPFLLFIIIGTTNATNLTDGLDGLLSGTAIISLLGFGFIAYSLDLNNVFSLIFALIGGLMAFLLFNRYPARIFMGDTGSLALGGALVGIAIITKTELLLVIIGAVFVIETISVILQVGSYKIRKKRIFKMAPLHHHFEESGWSEIKVVKTFYMVGLAFSLLGILLFLI